MTSRVSIAGAALLLTALATHTAAQSARAPALWGRLEPGVHAVGFRSLLLYDVSRPTLRAATDGTPAAGHARGRQMQLSVWYPARASARPTIRFEHYVHALAQELDFAPLDDARRRRGVAKFFDMPAARRGDTAALRRALPMILALPTAAVANASAASARYPLVLFHDWRAPAANSVMAEYLASHGYVVAATGLKGTFNADPDISAMGLETQAADLRFVLASVDSLPFVDAERIALIGVGIAASGALAFQMRTPAVDALVSLDGGITTPDELAMVRRSPYFDVAAMRVPILAINAPHPAVDANRLDIYRHATRYLVHFPRMGEFWFLNYGMLERYVPGIIGQAPGDTQLGFEWAARYVRRFLDAHLGSDRAAAAWLRADARANGVPDGVLVAETRAGVPVPAAADTSVAAMRRAFDFLVGSWRVESRTDSTGTTPSQGETYTFEKTLDGVVLSGRWHFNRGTLAQPDFADAVYYSAFDTRSRAWSFYYVSPQSAQYWPGELRDGRWEFTRSFTLNDRPMLQRQWWERVDDNTVRRHVENSGDGGRTWTPLVITLRRR